MLFVSRVLGVSIQVLANWRLRGTDGPEFVGEVRGKGNKIYKIYYRRAEVLAWLFRQRGRPKGPWKIYRDWLAERGVGLVEPTPEGVWWWRGAVDDAFP